jgi:hypothetical protein
MILSTHGIVGSQITQFVGLLDLYPSAAAAYSLRKLRSAYTGDAIEVRRTNNDVTDIGFTSTGELDTAALLAFTGTGALDNGFVTKWYDQSGNANNATQTTALNQPQIVSSGTILTKNSKPYLYASGSMFFNPINTNYVSIFTTFSADSSGLKSILGDSSGLLTYFTYNNYIGQEGKMITGYKNGGSVLVPSTFAYQQNVLKLLQIEDVGTGFYPNNYINNVLNTTGGITTDSKNASTVIFGSLVNRNFNGYCSEIIFYNISQLSNRTAISDNINNYYGIY